MGLLLVLLLLFASCTREAPKQKKRAMYYWNTSFAIDAQKEKFMANHRVERLYVRYFDVVMDEGGQPMPNATIRFDSAVQCRQEIVPTV